MMSAEVHFFLIVTCFITGRHHLLNPQIINSILHQNLMPNFKFCRGFGLGGEGGGDGGDGRRGGGWGRHNKGVPG